MMHGPVDLRFVQLLNATRTTETIWTLDIDGYEVRLHFWSGLGC
jgi:hypothetical protein